jgi:hypothetical protein
MTTAPGIRIGSLSVDGTPISQTDLARIEAEEKLNEDLQRKTVRVIAGAARDADDCRTLLEMLGIDSSVVLAARGTGTPPRGKPARKPAAKTAGRKRRVAAA